MRDPAKRALTWLLRLLGVGLLVWVLATQVQWQDRVALVNGDAWVGEVESVTKDSVFFREGARSEKSPGPLPHFIVPLERVSTRTYGEREVPDITYGLRTLLRRLRESLTTVLGVLLGLALLVVMVAFRWKLLLHAVGIDMPYLRVARLTFIGGFFNLAVPGATGGDFVKAWYAQKEARARYDGQRGMGTKAVLSVFVDRFLGLFGLVVFAAGVLLLTARGDAYDVPRIVVLIVLGVAIASGIVVVSRRVRRALGLSWLVRRLPFQNILEELQAAARLYRNHLGTLVATLGISLLNHAANATACYFLAQALGIQGVTLGGAMALVPLANLLSAIPLLPGGWGVGELAFAYFFGLVGVPATEAVGLSVVFRLAVLGVNLPGGLLWIFWKGHPSTETITADVEAAAARAVEKERLADDSDASEETP
ncbi:MAG: lysylphosphatidylglycerol synthase transmembrane domain-containing protein [Planctomycetota bacterium]|nr:lysylphosphatidylglycerol synthase transmembrane domain-containing protein [Planctomycetota bacterium]